MKIIKKKEKNLELKIKMDLKAKNLVKNLLKEGPNFDAFENLNHI